MAIRGRQLAIVTLGVAAAVALIAWVLDRRDRPDPTPGGPPRAVVQALEAAWAAPAVAPEASPQVPTLAATPPAGDDPSVEVCGVGRVPVDLLSGPAFEATFAALTESAKKLRTDRLSLGDDDWARAVGLRLDVGLDPASAPRAALAGLASLATTTRDPRVYALAWEACQPGRDGHPHPACAGVSTRRWAQLDAGNALPWLYLATEASERGDAAGLDEAMHQIAVAERIDSRWLAMSAHVLDRLDPDLHPVLRLAMTQAVYAVDSARSQPVYQGISRHCSDEALSDANRRERCTGIMRLLTERGHSAIDVSIGAVLAQRLGMPPQEVERLRALVHAVDAAVEATTGPPDARLSCRGVQGMADWSRAVQHGGEIGAVRRWAAAQGVTPEMMVERRRAFDREFEAARIAPPDASASKPAPASPRGP